MANRDWKRCPECEAILDYDHAHECLPAWRVWETTCHVMVVRSRSAYGAAERWALQAHGVKERLQDGHTIQVYVKRCDDGEPEESYELTAVPMNVIAQRSS